ncbi:hypothetical protein [Helicobacter rodentium]|uniref:hypothetical protein n=1 Tax=Helicobacter rodentium TaxID=59617 RepID=UPI0012EB9E6A|nr:hypothetical protein [Helicobacter rodentium]
MRFRIMDCHDFLRSLAMTKPKHLLLRHCEAKPKQSIIKHTEILTMESKKARFHIVDCHESRCDSRNDAEGFAIVPHKDTTCRNLVV